MIVRIYIYSTISDPGRQLLVQDMDHPVQCIRCELLVHLSCTNVLVKCVVCMDVNACMCGVCGPLISFYFRCQLFWFPRFLFDSVFVGTSDGTLAMFKSCSSMMLAVVTVSCAY